MHKTNTTVSYIISFLVYSIKIVVSYQKQLPILNLLEIKYLTSDAENSISEPLGFKIFWGSIPPTPRSSRLRRGQKLPRVSWKSVWLWPCVATVLMVGGGGGNCSLLNLESCASLWKNSGYVPESSLRKTIQSTVKFREGKRSEVYSWLFRFEKKNFC